MANRMKYIVEGGIFSDTTWTTVEVPESYGPFDSYQEAKRVWIQNTFTKKLDNCMHRLFIKEYHEN